MIYSKTYNIVKSFALYTFMLFYASLFAQSEKTSENSTIVMTKAELNSFLSTVAEARRAQINERENMKLGQAGLRLSQQERFAVFSSSRYDENSNQEILRELRYLNQRMDDLGYQNPNTSSNYRDNATLIMPRNAAQNPNFVSHVPNNLSSITVVPSNKTQLDALQSKIDSLIAVQSLGYGQSLTTNLQKNNVVTSSLNSLTKRLDDVRNQLDSLERNMDVNNKTKAPIGKISENRTYFMQQVYFDNNSTALDSEYLQNIQYLTQILFAYPEAKVMLEGWASPVGKQTYNKLISMRRAEVVERVFLDNNIDLRRVLISFRGEDKTSSEQLARRVEMSILVK